MLAGANGPLDHEDAVLCIFKLGPVLWVGAELSQGMVPEPADVLNLA